MQNLCWGWCMAITARRLIRRMYEEGHVGSRCKGATLSLCFRSRRLFPLRLPCFLRYSLLCLLINEECRVSLPSTTPALGDPRLSRRLDAMASCLRHSFQYLRNIVGGHSLSSGIRHHAFFIVPPKDPTNEIITTSLQDMDRAHGRSSHGHRGSVLCTMFGWDIAHKYTFV